MQNLVRVTVPCISRPFVLLAEEAYSFCFFNSNAPIFFKIIYMQELTIKGALPASEVRMIGRTVS